MINFLLPYRDEDLDLPDCVVLTRSKRAKRMALRLDTQARIVKLVIPQRASTRKAQEFVWAHESWVAEKLAELPTPIPFEDGAEIPLFGQQTTLDIYYDPDLKRTDISLKNNILSVKTNKEDPSARILRFLKNLALKELTALTEIKVKELGKNMPSVQIRDPKTRWGSCHEDGRISFSWRLILAPPAAMDYVVAHEVAHMEHMDHSRAFWKVCETLCDDYKNGKKWMRSQGHSLHSYGLSE